jgi:predicted RND superfamily exporter protein
MQAIIVSYLVIFYVVSTTFAKSTQVKSHYLFGLAALFLSTASCTTTLGILHHVGVELTMVPWYLYPIICGVASLENIFLMTNAVLYSGCDMQVKEKIARCKSIHHNFACIHSHLFVVTL